MKKFRKIFAATVALLCGLFTFSTANAAAWGMEFNGPFGSSFPCYGSGPGVVYNPVFTIYTITEPSDWPAFSEFGHAMAYPGQLSNPFYQVSTLNNSSGVTLAATDQFWVWGQPYYYVAFESLHWGIKNGNYVSATSGAEGASSQCYQ